MAIKGDDQAFAEIIRKFQDVAFWYAYNEDDMKTITENSAFYGVYFLKYKE